MSGLCLLSKDLTVCCVNQFQKLSRKPVICIFPNVAEACITGGKIRHNMIKHTQAWHQSLIRAGSMSALQPRENQVCLSPSMFTCVSDMPYVICRGCWHAVCLIATPFFVNVQLLVYCECNRSGRTHRTVHRWRSLPGFYTTSCPHHTRHTCHSWPWSWGRGRSPLAEDAQVKEKVEMWDLLECFEV